MSVRHHYHSMRNSGGVGSGSIATTHGSPNSIQPTTNLSSIVAAATARSGTTSNIAARQATNAYIQNCQHQTSYRHPCVCRDGQNSLIINMDPMQHYQMRPTSTNQRQNYFSSNARTATTQSNSNHDTNNTTTTTINDNNHAVIETHDSNLLPTHLKCGMCASLVFASVFVACVKFYFDHHGTGLEVLIFCAFSATFFLAACTVQGACRIPKGLLPTRSTSGSVLDEHGGAMCTLNAGIGSSGNTSNNGTNNLADSVFNQADEQLAMQERAAGPPPYHIAILLPENTNNKEVPPDESPPPSYDKILI